MTLRVPHFSPSSAVTKNTAKVWRVKGTCAGMEIQAQMVCGYQVNAGLGRVMGFKEGKFTQLLVQQEELKTLPFGEVWKEYCLSCGVPADGRWMQTVEDYESLVLRKRV